jgi:hypothetical protein
MSLLPLTGLRNSALWELDMHTTVQLTAEEFKTIHNGLCDLGIVCDRLENVLTPDLYRLLLQAQSQIRQGLENAYVQEQQDFERKHRHYDEVKREAGITHSEWSMYEVQNMTDQHPYANIDRVVYRSHWGPQPVSASITESIWSALWRAADTCIRDSGDSHHVFIEAITPDPQDPRILILSTGS